MDIGSFEKIKEMHMLFFANNHQNYIEGFIYHFISTFSVAWN